MTVVRTGCCKTAQASASSAHPAVFLISVGESTAEDAEDAEKIPIVI
jgi:hypothetical protein